MLFHSKTDKAVSKNNIVLDFIKGAVLAMIVSLVLVVVFALFVKWFSLSDKVIFPVTMIIKGISVVLGTLIAVKGENRGLFKGIAFGAVYIVFSFLLFGLLAGSFSLSMTSFLDIISACVLGGIVGIIKVNRK